MAKHWQCIGNTIQCNALVTIGKSLVEINMWQLWSSRIYECTGKRLAVIGNEHFTNRYQYIITLVACASVYNQSNSKIEFFSTDTFKDISCYNVESW